MRSLEATLLHLSCDMRAALLVSAAERLCRISAKANFDPNQPRVPRGRPDGGQWTDGGWGGENGPSSDGHPAEPGDVPWPEAERADDDEAQVHRVAERYADFIISLPVEEAIGGHAIKFHVAKTDAELIARARRLGTSQGSFLSLSEAEHWVRMVLAYKYQAAEQVASGALPQARLTMRFGTPTGREAYWNPRHQTYSIRATYSVFVYIKFDPRAPNRFNIHTAYPRNLDAMSKSIKTPPAFFIFTGYFLPEYIRFRNDEDFVRGTYQQFMRDEPEHLDELLDFLRRLLRANPSPERLFYLLSKECGSTWGVSGDMKKLFGLMLEIGEKEAATGKINDIPAWPLD